MCQVTLIRNIKNQVVVYDLDNTRRLNVDNKMPHLHYKMINYQDKADSAVAKQFFEGELTKNDLQRMIEYPYVASETK